MIKIEEPAGRAFEESALVRAIERGAVTLRAWSAGSAAMSALREWIPALRPQLGQVLVTAMVTHIALMVAIAPPPSWHWLILPSIILLAGLVLMVTRPEQRQR